jgi:hypothetical protein
MRYYLVLITTLLLFSLHAQDVVKKNERYYQLIAAEQLKGQTEVVLKDGTRVDILTDKVAIEVDWAGKWAEGIGQALHYSTMTGKHAGLVLIVRSDKDLKHVKKVLNIIRIKSLAIHLYVFTAEASTLSKVTE